MVDDPAATARRHRIPGSVRRAVIERDGRTCRLCGRPVVLRSARRRRTRVPGNQLTLDHVVPSSRGGAATVENLRVCCRDCNMRRGAPGSGGSR
jgi:5-methylcytosine-specific restriction endonuclease McrA